MGYLRDSEMRIRFLKSYAFKQGRQEVLKELDSLERETERLRENIERAMVGSYAATSIKTIDDEQAQQILLNDELILMEARNLFNILENEINVSSFGGNEFIQVLRKAIECITRCRELLLFREELVSGVTAKSAFELLAEKYRDQVDWLTSLLEKQTLMQISPLLSIRESAIVRFIDILRGSREKYIEKIILQFANTKGKELGGICPLSELFLAVDKLVKGVKISDVEKSVKKLEKEGLIPGIRIYSSGIKIVELLPSSLTEDKNLILNFASEKAGRVSLEDIIQKFSWSEERALKSLKELERAGICRYEVESRSWFFPSFIEKSTMEII
jgi:predicted transcriptional regulator